MNTPLHSSYSGGQHRNTEGSIVRVLETNAGIISRAVRYAVINPNRRKVLKLLACQEAITYQDILAALPVSERWARQLVLDFQAIGAIDVEGNPATISFRSQDIATAIKEILAFLASEWTAATASDGGGETLYDRIAAQFADHSTTAERYFKQLTKLVRMGGCGGGGGGV